MIRNLSLVLACLLVCELPRAAFAQDEVPVKLRDGWSEFPVGAWSRLRLIKQVRGEGDAFSDSSRRETLTRLTEIVDEGYKLQLSVVVDVGERSFDTEPRTISRGFARQKLGERIRAKRMGRGTFAVDGTVLNTELLQIKYGSGDSERIAKLQYVKDAFPFVVQQESQHAPLADQSQRTTTTTVAVTALDMPQRILSEMKSVVLVKAIQQQSHRTIVTHEVHCADIPGGLVSHSSITRNADEEIIERSTLTILDYGLDSKEIDQQSRARPVRARSRRLRSSTSG